MELISKKKNYYFFKTMINEFEKYDVISFDVFDTLLLRKVLFPNDIYKILGNQVQKLWKISDFRYLRINIENELKINNVNEDICIDDIYNEIGLRYPEIPITEIKRLELEIELENIIQNPYMKKIFDLAKDKDKEIWLIADSCLPLSFIEDVMKKCEYQGFKKIYVSGTEKKSKITGNIYLNILNQTGINPKKWLHIGDDYQNDINIPRSIGISTAYVRCPRDWFFMQREKERKEEKTNNCVAIKELDDSIEFAFETAKAINNNYTKMMKKTNEVIIKAENISMIFNMSNEKIDNFKEYVIRIIKRQLIFRKFLALNNVSFNIKRGERVGLIGLNGSGKSTMLKIVSGVMKPTKGKISVNGTIAPLIELGAGFDFELSARENIFLNGAIMGYNREEMKKYYNKIIEFAELKEFEDAAIKNFSSGMIARLGFAIATCHTPDILIIDEILSVGDYEFQKKCHKRMKELTKEGTTVLFVSHSAEDIISMCDKAIWLDHGNFIQEGEAQYIVEKYLHRQE